MVLGLPQMPIDDSAVKSVCPLNLIADCIPGKYRTYSGHCNNVRQPLWGAVYEPMQRLQPPEYADGTELAGKSLQMFAGISTPRIAKSGDALPNARKISRELFSAPKAGHNVCSIMVCDHGRRHLLTGVQSIAFCLYFH